uniref:Coiled-coil domain-containing protein n=1 Tax=Periophthalmus magnuspinnatus TaxID=409849 RepID=A0A3B4A313_9GOBI
MSSFATNGFSSTPVKKSRNREKDFHKPAALDLDVGVISDDEDTFSLLSPIYHDSFESGEDISQSSGQSPPKGTMDTSVLNVIILIFCRCELPKTPSDQMLSSAVPQKTPASLSAWELWLLNKAKEDRIKLEKKAEEERLLQEKKNQQEKDHEQKVAMINQRIQEWLKMKREQEQDLKQSKEQKDLMLQMQKQREIELKAQDKYKEWLQKKNQEKAEKEKKLKVTVYFYEYLAVHSSTKLYLITMLIFLWWIGGSCTKRSTRKGTTQEGRRKVQGMAYESLLVQLGHSRGDDTAKCSW